MSYIQKRNYELEEYEQLTNAEEGYFDPGSIWFALDMLGWPEAKKFSLLEILHILTESEKYYLNEGVPYTSTQDVLDNFPFASRTPYATVNVDGVEYWFEPDKVTLTEKFIDLVIPDGSVPFTKLVDVPHNSVLFRPSPGVGPIEVVDLQVLKDALNIPESYAKQVVYTIGLVAGDGSVDSRCNGAITRGQGTAAWVLSASDEIDLKVVHNLNRHIVDVKVFSVEVNGNRQMVNYNNALTGILALNSNELIIESLTTKEKAIFIHFIFS